MPYEKQSAKGVMYVWDTWMLNDKSNIGTSSQRSRKRARPSMESVVMQEKPEASYCFPKDEASQLPLTYWFLKDPPQETYYKLDLIFKASFPLDQLHLPLPSLEDDVSRDHSFVIHGLREVSGLTIKGGLQVLEHKFRDPPYLRASQPLIFYKELMREYWPRLGKNFPTDEDFHVYEDAKHNLGKYPREMFLLNTLLLGGGYIEKIEGIMRSNGYVAGGEYNCVQFIRHLEAGLGVLIEVVFKELPHRSKSLGILNLCILLIDSTWGCVSFSNTKRNYVLLDRKGTATSGAIGSHGPCPKRSITNTCVFILEDFRDSVSCRERIGKEGTQN